MWIILLQLNSKDQQHSERFYIFMIIAVFICVVRLHFVFHQPLLHALDLVDQKNVTKLTTPSGRVLYQVGI